MRILVTGAGGFVGEYLLRYLLEHQHEAAAMGIGGGAFLKEMGNKTVTKNLNKSV